MSIDPESVEPLTTVTTEFEAAAIVSALEAEGIRARAVGGFTAGFRAEAPGGVTVVVAEADLERAKVVVADLRRRGADVDWSQVDVDKPDESE
jgi:Putative prokaryotic signal transducing protein